MKLLPPINPSVSLIADYQKKLKEILDDMQNSVEYYLKSKIENAKESIFDANPVDDLQSKINEIKRRYTKRYKNFANLYAKALVKKVEIDTSKRLERQLKANEVMGVDFKMTSSMINTMKTSVKWNVSLIKTIPDKYFSRVESTIMESLNKGRDMAGLYTKLKDDYDLTKRQSYLIASDQTKKATYAITRTRKLELGLYKSIWRHSKVSKVPRPPHLKADGKPFDIRKGLKIDGEYIFPKQKIGCNCYEQTVIK